MTISCKKIHFLEDPKTLLDVIAVTDIGGEVSIVVTGINTTAAGLEKSNDVENDEKLFDSKRTFLDKNYLMIRAKD